MGSCEFTDQDLSGFYSEVWPVLFRFLGRLGACPSEAEDLMHNTFEKLLVRLREGGFDLSRGRAGIRSWIFKTAANEFRDRMRASGRREHLVWEDCENVLAAPAGHEAAELREIVALALWRTAQACQLDSKSKPPPCDVTCCLLEMHYGDEMTWEQMSTALGNPVGTVRGWTNVCARRFQRWIEAEERGAMS